MFYCNNKGVFMNFIMDETDLKVFNDFLLQSKNFEYIKQFENVLTVLLIVRRSIGTIQISML